MNALRVVLVVLVRPLRRAARAMRTLTSGWIVAVILSTFTLASTAAAASSYPPERSAVGPAGTCMYDARLSDSSVASGSGARLSIAARGLAQRGCDNPGAPMYDAPPLSRVLHSAMATNTPAGARFVVNGAGETLDLARVTIPEGKFGYLLENPSKAGVFGSKGMGFSQAELDAALRQHLVDNFGRATSSTAMTGGGTKFSVTGAMTGPSGQKWTITTAWGVDPNGTIRLITATP